MDIKKKMGMRLTDADEFQRQHDDKHGGVVYRSKSFTNIGVVFKAR